MRKGVPVKAVAASVSVRTQLFTRTVELKELSTGDLVVSVGSAVDGAREVEGLGGREVIECGYLLLGAKDMLATTSCEHSSETRDRRFLRAAAAEVRKAVGEPGTSPVIRVDPNEIIGFATPSGNIPCELSTYGLRCDVHEHTWTAPAHPPDCLVDWGNTILLGDKAEWGCVGDVGPGWVKS